MNRFNRYDLAGRLLSVDGPLPGTDDITHYRYDAAGNRTSLRKRDGRTIALAYDALNRVTAKTYPQGGARPVYYGYDLRNLQLFARYDSPTGEGITNAWDGFGRLTSSSTDMGGTPRLLQYQYDPAGNRIRITHPDGNYFTATYDALSRQFWIHEQGIHGKVVAGYNPFGSFAGTSRSNGTLTNYGYDAVQRPNAYYHDLGGSAADGLWLFSRNPAGQIGSTTRENNAYAWTGHYAVNRAYTTDGLNRYSGAGGASFTYDLNGNLTSDGARTFTYDIENRLVGASPNVALSYDPLGRLHEVSGASGTTRFLYDGDALVAEYVAGTMTRRYVHWTGADVPMLSYVGTDLTQLSQLHADERGSIIATTDAAGTATINSYDEYGIPAAGNSGRFQYTGQAWIPELGMYHYKARVYSPTLGRFMQTDPIGYDDQFNLYAYVGNDPVNRSDPTGRATYDCSGGVGTGNCAKGTVLRGGDIVRTRYGNLGISQRDGFTIASPLPGGRLSAGQVSAIVFNETRSLNGDGIDRARRNVAHAVMNGDVERGARRPSTAGTTANVPEVERRTYQRAQDMVRRANAERSLGFDPTRGAIHFNLRTSGSMGPFMGHIVSTHDGPFNNSFPNRDVPASRGIYVNTYRDED